MIEVKKVKNMNDVFSEDIRKDAEKIFKDEKSADSDKGKYSASGHCFKTPCDIGDSIWTLNGDEIEKYTVTGIGIETVKDDIWDDETHETLTIHCKNNRDYMVIPNAKQGKNFYLSKEDAIRKIRNNKRFAEHFSVDAAKDAAPAELKFLDVLLSDVEDILNAYRQYMEDLQDKEDGMDSE